MNLATALRVQKGSVVTLTGAGGKTTAMLHLGRELAAQGLRVIATTTTRLGTDQLDSFPAYLVSSDPEHIDTALDDSNFLLVVRELDVYHGKALGFPVKEIAEFRNYADVVLVEGDGANQRPLKAPADHEPVIPSETTHLVTVLGLWALNHPLDAETVHRPELFAKLTAMNSGDLITPGVLARLALHPDGPARGAPAGAERHLLLNGVEVFDVNDGYLENFPAVDTNTQYPISSIQHMAARVAAQSAFSAVHLAQLAHDPPVLESYGQMAAVVLAAGGSSRFGSPKQLHEWEGQALLQHVVMQVLAAPVQQVFVVLGAYYEEIAPLFYGWPVILINDEDWEQGQSTSMQVGLQACAIGTQAVMFVLGDQPNLPADLLLELVDTYRRTQAPIIAPRYGNRRGNPVIFDRQCFPELMSITATQVVGFFLSVIGIRLSGWKQKRVCFWTSTSLGTPVTDILAQDNQIQLVFNENNGFDLTERLAPCTPKSKPDLRQLGLGGSTTT